MLLFIDESGSFTVNDGRPSISCVAGLIVPHACYARLSAGVSELKQRWGLASDVEIKGNRLNESQIAEFIELLLAHRVTVSAVVFDSRFTTTDFVTAHRIDQARRITARVDHRFSREMRLFYQQLRRTCRGMSNQLYVQARLLIPLCQESLQMMLVEYPTTHASELGLIEVIVDAKDRTLTAYDQFWRTIILPLLEQSSAKRPLGMIQGADYSHFDRSYRGTTDAIPPHLADLFDGVSTPMEYTDIGRIFGRVRIEQSHEHVGLQMADVVANTLGRMLRGNLQHSGWRRFPRLFIHQRAGTVEIAVIGNGGLPPEPPPYHLELAYLHENARPLSLHRQ